MDQVATTTSAGSTDLDILLELCCCPSSLRDHEKMFSRINSSSKIWACEALYSSSNASVSSRCPWIESWKLDSSENWASPSARTALSGLSFQRCPGGSNQNQEKDRMTRLKRHHLQRVSQLTGWDVISVHTKEPERHCTGRHVEEYLIVHGQPGTACMHANW